MHRHRIRAFVTGGAGETDVPIAIFAEGQFLRFVGGAVRTFGLGPGTTTINALATWGDTTGTQLLNTSVLLDSSGNMTALVTLDGQDAPNITAKVGADPVLTEVTVWASTSAPWKLGRSGVKINPGGDMTDVTTLNGRSPGILVGRSPTSTPAATSVMVHKDTTGIVSDATPVLIDSSGNITGVTTINGTTVGNWVQGPASATDAAIAVFDGTTGKLVRNSAVFIASTQIYGLTFIRSIGVGEHTLGGTLPTDTLSAINSITLGTTTISNVTALDGVDPLTWVVGPSSVTANRVATFNGTTGKLIQQTSVAISSGDVTGVTSINTIDPATWVVGPASATSNALATFSGTTGKLIQSATSITASSGTLSSVTGINSMTVGATSVSGVTALNSITVGSTTLAGVTTLNSVDPATWVVGPSSATSGAIALFSGTSGKLLSDSGQTMAYIQRGTAAILGTYSITTGGLSGGSGFAPGYGFEQESSSYKAVFVADIPVSFPDTSVTLTFTVTTTDNAGRWQIHTPNSSAHVAMGSSGTFVNGTPTAFAVAAFRIVASCTVPSGSGFGYSINVSITSSGTAATMEAGGTQFWVRAV